MYFFLLTKYFNYVAFDKYLHYWVDFKKKAIAKITKGAAFWKQPLGNILFKMLYF